MTQAPREPIRHDWTSEEVQALFALPFMDLLLRAQAVHRVHHVPNAVQMSTLLSIKTGACPEDCAYCPQSVRYTTGVEAQPLMQLAEVRAAARRARDAGATRFCLGAAYRSPKAREHPGDRGHDRARCARSDLRPARRSACSSPGRRRRSRKPGSTTTTTISIPPSEFYAQIISTRTYQDRLDTLGAVRAAGLKVCCGGIVGLGESPADRAELLRTLANLPRAPRERADEPAGAGCRARRWRTARRSTHSTSCARIAVARAAHAGRPRTPVRRSRGDER